MSHTDLIYSVSVVQYLTSIIVVGRINIYYFIFLFISHYYGFISEGDLRHYTVTYSAVRPVPGLLIYVINIYTDLNYHIMNLEILKNEKNRNCAKWKKNFLQFRTSCFNKIQRPNLTD